MSKRPRPSVLDDLRLSDGRLVSDVMRERGLSEATVRGRLKKGEPPDLAVRPVPPRPPLDTSKYERPYSRQLAKEFRRLLPILGPLAERIQRATSDAIAAGVVEDGLRAELLELKAEGIELRESLSADQSMVKDRLAVLDQIRLNESQQAKLQIRIEDAAKRRRLASEKRDSLRHEAQPYGVQVLALGAFNARPAVAEYLSSIQ